MMKMMLESQTVQLKISSAYACDFIYGYKGWCIILLIYWMS